MKRLANSRAVSHLLHKKLLTNYLLKSVTESTFKKDILKDFQIIIIRCILIISSIIQYLILKHVTASIAKYVSGIINTVTRRHLTDLS